MRGGKWTVEQIPDLTGKVVVITGANTGLGKENARALAGRNATVVLAVRSEEKGHAAAEEIRGANPSARLVVNTLDLASLESVRNFVDCFSSHHDRLDLLINNAGVMFCPFAQTADGFEMQFGTNHLGHFALTLLLLPLLRGTPDSRVVNVASLAHRGARLDLDDLNWRTRKYNTQTAYCDSKLANLLFTLELAQRLRSHENWPLVVAAHPGMTQTDLMRHMKIGKRLVRLITQSVEKGMLPTLRAALDPEAAPGDYFGPAGLLEFRGYPIKVSPNKRALDKAAAQRLWELSEEMTGIVY